ncbi:Coenzyme F420 hydrogenase/dehydrogenase, beta subunit C-terminal domain [Agromyces aurantiacus]|uniref:Coenzyme F420 hydrogenase/dehydrogenase, beta subunit C-terminal domain n=1 Tax=Agromyces aurantiacus TaxID=165814 RepID=A0ABV9R6V1_9MICO|nr:Coenzyme F420 hydrogenase/dehydrogenase, beta subunit C-terminal domain [Agromyces aurantiacus]MBM7502743.1 coenzyme F420-reducing hydrogenase beta subunit [Agromyces aurantiacus]
MAHTISDVVARGMCVGCGGCAIRTGGAIPVRLDRYGMFQADLTAADPEQLEAADRVCPFSDSSPDEDQVSEAHYAELPTHPRIGRYRSVYAGRVVDDDRIVGSSSGGLTSWFLGELLDRSLVDGVIHVGKGEGSELFRYTVSRTSGDLLADRKSMYASTTLDEVVREVRGDGRTYAVVGVPCFITAVRHLEREDEVLRRQFTWHVGLVCGHLKSRFFAESLAWQAGVRPDELEGIDFRVKNPARRSYSYDYLARGRGGRARLRRTLSAIDGSWGYGAFQPGACNFCDDVFAETADVVFGDAWLPQYTEDWQGTNVLVTRAAEADRILGDGVRDGAIRLEPLTTDLAAQSQAGNFRHRRDGLRVRLADDLADGLSVPRKRVSPGYDGVSSQRIALIRQRRAMSELSFAAFLDARTSGRLSAYTAPMRAAIRRYRRIESEGKSLPTRAREALRSVLRRG